MICLTEESTQALILHNRKISKSIVKLAREEIEKLAKPWQELGTTKELESNFLKTSRSLLEIDLSLPISQLCRDRQLSNCSADELRDGCVELTPLYEKFVNVKFLTISQACQTNLVGKDAEAQTYPGNLKHRWTQYELEIPEGFAEIWNVEEKPKEQVKKKIIIIVMN